MLLLGHLFTYWPKWVTLFSYSGFLTDDPATYAPTTNPVLKSLWEIVHFLKVRTNWTSSAVLYSRLRKPGYKLIIVLVHSLYFLTYIFRFLNLFIHLWYLGVQMTHFMWDCAPFFLSPHPTLKCRWRQNDRYEFKKKCTDLNRHTSWIPKVIITKKSCWNNSKVLLFSFINTGI